MNRPATISFCSLAGVILLIAVVQSCRVYRRDRALRPSRKAVGAEQPGSGGGDRSAGGNGDEEGQITGGGGADGEGRAMQASGDSIDSVGNGYPSSSSSGGHAGAGRSMYQEQVVGAGGGAGDESAWVGAGREQVMAMPASTVGAQFRGVSDFQHLSLVPSPLDPRRGQGQVPEESDVGIYPVSRGRFHEHPHPLQQHPAPVESSVQEFDSSRGLGRQPLQQSLPVSPATEDLSQKHSSITPRYASNTGGYQRATQSSFSGALPARWSWSTDADRVTESGNRDSNIGTGMFADVELWLRRS